MVTLNSDDGLNLLYEVGSILVHHRRTLGLPLLPLADQVVHLTRSDVSRVLNLVRVYYIAMRHLFC